MNGDLRLIVTGSQRSDRILQPGVDFAEALGLPLVTRGRRSLSDLAQQTGADGIVVWQDQGPVLYLEGQSFFFHPSMAKNRISMVKKQLGEDAMVRAMDLAPGDRVLDCTLGLGADAIMAAYITGDEGQVTGLEKVAVLAAIVKYGLAHYSTPMKDLLAAMRRITVINADHRDYLPRLATDSFDIVYFDPMFRHPVASSTGISPLRRIADPAPLERVAVQEAVRVARRKVVIKERHGSSEFARLGCQEIIGGPSSSVAYGVIHTG